MSTNCIRCVVNRRTNVDLLCDSCREIINLRILLAQAYSGARLYVDDGELRDSTVAPFIDFKRDSVLVIAAKMRQRGEAAIAKASQTTEAKS